MQLHHLLLGGAFALLQSPPPSSRVPVPLESPPPAVPGPVRTSAPEGAIPLTYGGSGSVAEVGERDDSVPLPVPAVRRPGPDGDVLETPASGDPHFLGFAAGKHYPPAGERIDPELIRNVRSQWTDGRAAQETYAFVMFQKRITRSRVAELESMGVRVLGFHPHYCLKVALPPIAIDMVAAHPAVRWIGVARDWQKVHPMLGERLAAARPGEPVDVWINVFESDLGQESRSEPIGELEEADATGVREAPAGAQRPGRWMSNGWQQAALRQVGAEVIEYVDGMRAFQARIAPSALPMITELDCVQFVEPFLNESTTHDESTPLIHSDRTRLYYNGGTTSSAIAGQIDTGVLNSHNGLGVNGVGADFTGQPTSAWFDECGHGSHVAGTILGDGAGDPSLAGNAPGLGWGTTGRFYNAKWLLPGPNAKCIANSALSGPLNFMHTPFTDGNGDTTPIPHVVNNSWGATGVFFGTELTCRSIDDEVYDFDQMYVFAAGNDGPAGNTINSGGSAKNAFTVGSVTSFAGLTSGLPGDLAGSSSRGPTGDLRWKPNVVAPGVSIMSVDSTNAPNGYIQKSGTSMAAPHVTGVVAQIVDHYSWLRYEPAMLASLLMAGATTKNDAILTSPSASSNDHLNEFGAGRVDAYRASYQSSQIVTINQGFTQDGGVYQYNDFIVSPGATRLIVAYTYLEPSASSGASQALIDDYDLYLDAPPIDTLAGNTGEFTAQQSNINNTEIRILENPAIGTWRWKSWPENVVSNDDIHAGITVTVIYGDTTPAIDLALTASDHYVQPGEDVDLSATVSCPDFVASGVNLLTDITYPVTRFRASTTLFDGAVTDLRFNESLGWKPVLGDILHGYDRTAEWTVDWLTEGVKTFDVEARCDNAPNPHGVLTVTVDGTAPGLVTNLISTTHDINVWSNQIQIDYTWTEAPDNLSGVNGYSVLTTSGAPGVPPANKNLGNVTSFGETLATSLTGYWFNIRAVDKSGNWGTEKSRGPFLIDTVNPSLPGLPTSTTHTPSVTDCDTAFDIGWTASTDAHSGVAGYRVLIDHNVLTSPTQSDPLVTGLSTSATLTPGTWYAHVRAEDLAGNLGLARHAGPFLVTGPAAIYCTAKVNSLGCTPTILVTGSPRISALSGFTILCANVRNNKPGLLIYGTSGAAATPFMGGTMCINAPVRRAVGVNSGGSAFPADDCSGAYSMDFIAFANGLLGGNPQPNLTTPGTDVWAQWWGRDNGFAAPNNVTLSNAVTFELCQ